MRITTRTAPVAAGTTTEMAWLTRVQSHSMAPTLRDGALALTLRLGRRATLRRGDIVVADSHELGRRVVKRIVGLPGESVDLRAGQVHIDGQPLAEPYASRSVFTDSFQVPSNELGVRRCVAAPSVKIIHGAMVISSPFKLPLNKSLVADAPDKQAHPVGQECA